MSAVVAPACAVARVIDTSATPTPFVRTSTSFWVSRSVALTRSSASSYGRGSITNSRSPSCTNWLSCTGSSTIWPLTSGATPIKLARTVASSVWGCTCHCQMVRVMATTAPAMIHMPMSLPMALCTGAVVSTSFIGLVPQEEQPGGQCAQDDQTGVDQAPWPQVRMQVRRYEELTRNPSDHEADHDRQHPGRKKGSQHVDGWPHTASRQRQGEDCQCQPCRASPVPGACVGASQRRSRARLDHGVVASS